MLVRHPFPPHIRKKIIPAILAHSKKEFLHKLFLIQKYYPANRFQLDVLDGKFIPYEAWCSLSEIKKMNLKGFDAHLMIAHPQRSFKKWKNAGADRIFFHYEAVSNPLPVLMELKRLRIKAGIALNPETPPDILPLLIPLLDAILLMGEHPGYGGQPFRKSILGKIKHVRKLAPKIPLIIDGGVTSQSASLLLKAGANQLASGHTALSPFEKL
ncbi:MAG: hypothetical protein AAB400_01190 [Patescibacteria group bacterium]